MKIRRLFPLAGFLMCMPVVMVRAAVFAPKAGVVRQQDGTVRTIQGLRASYVLGPVLARHADTASFSAQGGLIASGGLLTLFDSSGRILAQYESGEKSPVLGMQGARADAVAYLPSKRSLVVWNGSKFEELAIQQDLGGTVLSLTAHDQSADLIVGRADGSRAKVTASVKTGEISSVSELPGVHGNVVDHDGEIVSVDERGIHIENANGAYREFPIAGDGATLEWMADAVLHISSASHKRDWALHLLPTGPELSELPSGRNGQ